MSKQRRFTAAAFATILAFSLSAPAGAAAPADDEYVRIVLTDATGKDHKVTSEEFQELADAGKLDALIVDTPKTQKTPDVSTRAIVREEGSTFKSIKIYFNKDETNRIAAGAGLCLTVVSNFAGKGALVLKPACLGLTVYATSAIVAGRCVGIAKSAVPATAYPIYHKGKSTCK